MDLWYTLYNIYTIYTFIYIYINWISRATASFLATDLDSSKSLTMSEIHSLYWLVEGYELTETRIKKEMETIDTDKNGVISIDEWINYLITTDPVTGLPCFDLELRQKFVKVYIYIYIYIYSMTQTKRGASI